METLIDSNKFRTVTSQTEMTYFQLSSGTIC